MNKSETESATECGETDEDSMTLIDTSIEIAVLEGVTNVSIVNHRNMYTLL